MLHQLFQALMLARLEASGKLHEPSERTAAAGGAPVWGAVPEAIYTLVKS